jgi:serine protease Do
MRAGSRQRNAVLLLIATAALLVGAVAAPAQASTLDDMVAAVVRIKTFINPDGRSVENLGREREGSGIVIDGSGLVLTIGYLMVEAHAAEIITNSGRAVPATIVGYDHDTGFGLLRAIEPLQIKPLAFGKSAEVKEKDPELVASFGGAGMVLPVHVVSRRAFAGSWEYLVESAIYTTPPHPAWSGAALINRDGKLVGVGSLAVGDASGDHGNVAGNLFVPIDGLLPILADLLAKGRASGPGKPWLGVGAQEIHGSLFVGRVSAGGPAAKSGIKRGDIIVGVNGSQTHTLAEFYRRLWAAGSAGVTVELEILSDGEPRRVPVTSVNRLDQLKLKSTF